MYCWFCVVLCIVCVYMCTELLSPGGYPIAVKYIISYHSVIPRLKPLNSTAGMHRRHIFCCTKRQWNWRLWKIYPKVATLFIAWNMSAFT